MTSLKGNLNSVDLANIFQMLSLNQREGTLYIFEGASRKAIYFGHDGVSMLAKGRAKSDALGRILLRHDHVSPDQLASAVQKRLESGRLLGQVLVEEGVCTRAVIEEALQLQIEEEVYSLFIWKDAQFEFVEGPPDEEFRAEGVQKLTFNVNRLIMEAAKRVDEWAWIQSVVPDSQEVYRYTGRNIDLADPVFQESYSGKVLAAIEGRRSVDEIIEASYVNRFEVCRILAILCEGGAIEKLPVPELRREADAAVAAGDTDAAVKFLSRLVAVKGDTPQMHKQLAEAFESERELERAAAHYRVYADIQAGQHQVKEAFLVYRRICEFLPTDLAAADRMIEVFASGPDGLEEHAKEIVERGKELAEIYLELDRSSRAIQVLHRVVSLGPDDVDLRGRLIQVYMQSGMTGEAIAEYEALAETSLAVKDYEGAEKIFRKILAIDRNRADASARLNQILSKKKRRAQNIRNLVVGVALAGAAVVGGLYALDLYKKYDAEQERIRIESGDRLQALRVTVSGVAVDIDSVLREFFVRTNDLALLGRTLHSEKPKLAELESRANTVVQQIAELRSDFPEAQASKEAGQLANDVSVRVTNLRKRIAETQRTLRDSADNYVEQAQEGLKTFQPTRANLAYLDLAVSITEDCDNWGSTEHGQQCTDLRTQLKNYIVKFDQVRAAVLAKVAEGSVEDAQRLAIAYVGDDKDFPPPDLREEMPFPLLVRSKPAGARVTAKDDADASRVTPCVLTMSILKGASFDVDLAGFTSAHVDIPAMKDPFEVAQRMPRVRDVTLEKKQFFRRATSDGKPLAVAPIAGTNYIVLSGTARQNDLLDPHRGGEISGSIVMNSSSPIRSGGVVWEHEGSVPVVVLPTADGTLYFYDAHSGHAIGQWNEAKAGVSTDLVLAGDDVLVADERGGLHLVNVVTHKSVWDYVARGPAGESARFSTGPVVAEGKAYIGCENGSVHVVDLAGPKSGAVVVAPASSASRVCAPPTVDGGALYVLTRNARETLLTRWNLEAAGWTTAWTKTIAGDVRGAPLTRDGTVFCVSSNADVRGFDAKDGSPTRSGNLAPGARVVVDAVIDGPYAYVAVSGGVLFALDLRAKEIEPLWKYKLPAPGGKQPEITTRCVVASGLLLFGASDNSVYALEAR